MEVDLHIENLIDSHRGMPNYQIVDVQMARFRRSMNIAISRNMKRVVFIHGVGAGVLREEIRTELRSIYPQYEFLDGSYQRYGAGATEVLLRG
jgi:dsDNA-specific endonuclease/ATPase MutS2